MKRSKITRTLHTQQNWKKNRQHRHVLALYTVSLHRMMGNIRHIRQSSEFTFRPKQILLASAAGFHRRTIIKNNMEHACRQRLRTTTTTKSLKYYERCFSTALLLLLLHHQHRPHHDAYCFAYSLLRTTLEPVTPAEIGYGDDLLFADVPPLLIFPDVDPFSGAKTTAAPDAASNHSGGSSSGAIVAPRIVNLDTRFTAWSRRYPVPYFIDPAYTTSETNVIQSAFEQIETDLQYCVQFKRIFITPATSTPAITYGYQQQQAALREQRPAAFLYVTPLERGQPTTTCYSFPGMVRHQRGRGQIVSIARGDSAAGGGGGCAMDKREIMKVIVHSLGLRNVHRRADRDQYITVLDENVDVNFRLIQPFQKYRSDQATSYLTSNHQPAIDLPYDYNSVTHHQPTQYAKAGTVVFTTRDGRPVGNRARLSYWDCIALKWIYYCDKSSCQDPYGDSFSSSSTTASSSSSSSSSMSTSITSSSNSMPTTGATTSPVMGSSTAGGSVEPATGTSNSGQQLETTTLALTSAPPDMTTNTPMQTGEAATATPTSSNMATTPTTVMPATGEPPVTTPSALATTTTTASNVASSTLETRSSEICSPAFRVDAAMLGSDAKIYLFSGSSIWKMDQDGIVDPTGAIDANTVLLTPPPDSRPLPLPIKSAWFDGLYSQIVDANGQQWQTDILTILTPVTPPAGQPQLMAAFTTIAKPDANTAGGGVQRDSWFLDNAQMIRFTQGGTPTPLASVFASSSTLKYPTNIDAAFGFRFATEDLIVVYEGNSYYVLKPCASNSPATPCLELHEQNVYPLNIATQIVYAEGNC